MLSREEILRYLEDEDFAALVGQFESPWLECKRSPYLLPNDGQRLELAKDVSALANASGGLILLGFSTKRDETHGSDVIDAVNPIQLALFDEGQYRTVIADWTWPKLTGVVIRVYPETARKTHGVVSLDVPKATASEYPTLICKSILDDGRRADIVYGYCERKQAGVAHHDLPRFHALIVQGMRNTAILERLDALVALQANTSPSTPTPLANENAGGEPIQRSLPTMPLKVAPENVEKRIEEAVTAVKLDQQPRFILAAFPIGTIDVRELFESKSSPLVQLIERPPEIRSSGFDLTADYSSHIVRGALRRSVSVEHKLLEMHRDGLVIFVNRGDGDGLCWGRASAQAEESWINQLFLVENVYLFTQFVARAYEGRLPTDFEISYRLLLLNVCSPARRCVLTSGPLDRWGYGSTHREEEPNVSISLKGARTMTPERVAFLLLSELYAWFAFDITQIPYTKETSTEGHVIDMDALLTAGKG
jgi:hypothetical protein